MNDEATALQRQQIDQDIEHAWGIRRKERKASHDLIMPLYQKCIDIDYDYGKACAEVVVAVHELYEAAFEAGLSRLMRIVEFFDPDKEPIWYSRIMNNMGFGYVNMGRYDRAIDYLNEGIRVARAYEVDEMLVYLLGNLAEIELDLSIARYEEAYELLVEGYEVGIKSQATILPLIKAYMAYSAERTGQWALAKQHADEAQVLAMACIDVNTVDQCYHFLGEMYYNHKDYHSAIKLANMSIEKQLTYSENYGLTSNYYLLARCYFELNDKVGTKAYSKLAMDNAELLGMESIVGGVAELMSRILEREGDYAASNEQLKKVIIQNSKKFTQDLNNHISIISAELRNLAIKKDAEIYRLKNVELKEKSEALERSIIELKEAQQQLVYQEKMAALGNLIAGIAHEINTPFAVIQAAVQNVNKYISQVIPVDYPELLFKLDEQTRAAFLSVIISASQPHEMLSTAEERNIRYQLRDELENKGFVNAVKVSDWLLDMHLRSITDEVILVLKSPLKDELMKVCYELSGIMRNLSNIQRAVIKGSKTVFALKHYTHFQPSLDLAFVDPMEEIKTIVQLYEHQIKQKVELIWNVSGSCVIECFPDELNQVWMNLIQNALQAMSFEGRLTITSKCLTDQLEVIIEDTGCGIPAEHAERVFEPFFTTKKQGVGSGLGLHLVKRIIDKHAGSISFTSREGQTQFKVTLPIRQPRND